MPSEERSSREKRLKSNEKAQNRKLKFRGKSQAECNSDRLFEPSLENLRDNGFVYDSDYIATLNLPIPLDIQDQIKNVFSEGPTLICFICHRLNFLSKLRRGTENQLCAYIENYGSQQCALLCATCQRHAEKGKIPALNANDFGDFPEVDAKILELNELEVQLISKRIVFMKILRYFRMKNGQFKLKGNVVNVPLDINDTTKVLPRQFSQCQTLMLQLKRQLGSNSIVDLARNVRVNKVWDALQALMDTPLYADIKQNFQWLDEAIKLADFVKQYDDSACVDEEDEVPAGDTILMPIVDHSVMDEYIQFAPAEKQRPLFPLLDPNCEEMAFVKIWGGEKRKVTATMKNYHTLNKYELMNFDRRCASCVDNLLFRAAVTIHRTLIRQASVITFKKAGQTHVSPEEASDSTFVRNLVNKDEAYRLLEHVSTSPAHWAKQQKLVLAMVRQLGLPTLFMTFSPSEKDWNDLIRILYKNVTGCPISDDDVDSMTADQKHDLISKDPVTCAVYFDYRFRAFLRLMIKSPDGAFGQHRVVQYYFRVEYQMRGSPHVHMIVWLENAPLTSREDLKNLSGPNIKSIERFVNQFITCDSRKADPDVVRFQRHMHTSTCYRSSLRDKKNCRFNIPFPPMRKTRVLVCAADVAEKRQSREGRKFLQEKREQLDAMRDLLHEDRINDFAFDEWLHELGLDDEGEYLTLLSYAIKKPTIFLKRKVCDRWINPFHPMLLNAWRANMDIQFILDVYGCVVYVLNYINKANKGQSKAMKELIDSFHGGDQNTTSFLQKVTRSFLSTQEISAQESVFVCLGMSQHETSTGHVYVPADPLRNRHRILKKPEVLSKLRKLPIDDESRNNVFQDGIVEHYMQRPRSLDGQCLADFATWYEIKQIRSKSKESGGSESDEDEEESDEEGESGNRLKMLNNYSSCYRRKKQKILRHHVTKMEESEIRWYRQQVMLFLPWRNEQQDLDDENAIENIYDTNEHQIRLKRDEYNKIDDGDITAAMVLAEKEELEGEEEWKPDDRFMHLLPEEGIEETDVNDDQDNERLGNIAILKAKIPGAMDQQQFNDLVASLNQRQRKLALHVNHHLKQQFFNASNALEPLRIFVSGPAGTGKSTLIKILSELCRRVAGLDVHGNFESLKTLLVAPTGKAARVINGLTIHSALSLPVEQSGKSMADLSQEIANTIRIKLNDVKLLIIDELSMVSRQLFLRVDKRLRQIFAGNEIFGGLNVITFGDFYQLPPVFGRPVYRHSQEHDKSESFESSLLWSQFVSFPLTEVMRQKDDKLFAQVLTRFGQGDATDFDMTFLRKCEVSKPNPGYVQLFHRNVDVDAHNKEKLQQLPGGYCISTARNSGRTAVIAKFADLDINRLHGLRSEILLKIDGRYMIVCNIDVGDGLVNGSVGVLKRWDIGRLEGGQEAVERVWLEMEFETDGKIARERNQNLMKKFRIPHTWTPIETVKKKIQVEKRASQYAFRKQLPISPAHALTIHKSQGSTYPDGVCVHITGKESLALLYTAFTRVTDSRRLKIVGKLPDKKYQADPAVQNEMSRREENQLMTLSNRISAAGVECIFLNILSFHMHSSEIANDEVFLSSKIIFLCETGLSESSNAAIAGFVEIARISVPELEHRKQGLSCFVKLDLDVKLIQCKNRSFGQGHVEYICIEMEELCFIGVYFSPKVPHHVLNDFVNHWAKKFGQINIIGDFNQDLSKLSHDNEVFKMYGLQPLIHCPTTIRGTCIDNILSNCNLFGGTYNSLTSDHLPIFLSKQEIEKAITRKVLEQVDGISEQLEHSTISSIASPRETDGDSDDNVDVSPIDATISTMTRLGSDLLIRLRGIIFGSIVTPDIPQSQWNWIRALNGESLKIHLNGMLAQIRTLVGNRSEQRMRLLRFPSDDGEISHLPEPLRRSYKSIRTTGNGSCFYNAISLLLVGDESLTPVLRLLILYMMAMFRQKIEILASGVELHGEALSTCKIANQAGCGSMHECFANIVDVILMSEVLQSPVLILSYGNDMSGKSWSEQKQMADDFNLAIMNDPYKTAESMGELNRMIMDNPLSCWKYVGHCVRQQYSGRPSFVISLYQIHYTALLKKSDDHPDLAFRNQQIKFDD